MTGPTRVLIPPALSPDAFRRREAGARIETLGGTTMGTRWSARIVAPAGALPRGAQGAIDDALALVIGQMSQWEASSDLSRFNAAAPGTWRALPPELVRVLRAAIDIARASGGAFDPAMGALTDLWGFGPPGPRTAPPDDDAIEAARGTGGIAAIELDAPLLRARRLGLVRLDFSGIAKGFAVDLVAQRLANIGLYDFVIEIGGELVGRGIRPDGQPWWVDLEPVPGAPLAPVRIALHGLAVATSGDYRRHFEAGGRRYAHSIDPRTGRPCENAVAAVTVLHEEAMRADAWATALTVLGGEGGMAVAEREGLAARIVLRREGTAWERCSPAWNAMLG